MGGCTDYIGTVCYRVKSYCIDVLVLLSYIPLALGSFLAYVLWATAFLTIAPFMKVAVPATTFVHV